MSESFKTFLKICVGEGLKIGIMNVQYQSIVCLSTLKDLKGLFSDPDLLASTRFGGLSLFCFIYIFCDMMAKLC